MHTQRQLMFETSRFERLIYRVASERYHFRFGFYCRSMIINISHYKTLFRMFEEVDFLSWYRVEKIKGWFNFGCAENYKRTCDGLQLESQLCRNNLRAIFSIRQLISGNVAVSMETRILCIYLCAAQKQLLFQVYLY